MARKVITTESYIEEVNEIHDGLYTYENTVYTGMRNNVIVTCKIHGNFSIIAANHKRGSGCQKCSIESQSKKVSKTEEQFLEEAKIKHNDFYDYSKVVYKGCRVPVVIVCPYHQEFSQQPAHHLRGCGCPECGRFKKNTFSKYKAPFLEKAKKKFGDKFDYSKARFAGGQLAISIGCPDQGFSN